VRPPELGYVAARQKEETSSVLIRPPRDPDAVSQCSQYFRHNRRGLLSSNSLCLCHRRIYDEGIMFAGMPCGCPLSVRVCPSVNIYFAWCDISVLRGWISMKFDINVCHVSGRGWIGLQDQRSDVKRGQEVSVQLTHTGGSKHFNGVAWSLSCLMLQITTL